MPELADMLTGGGADQVSAAPASVVELASPAQVNASTGIVPVIGKPALPGMPVATSFLGKAQNAYSSLVAKVSPSVAKVTGAGTADFWTAWTLPVVVLALAAGVALIVRAAMAGHTVVLGVAKGKGHKIKS